MEKKKKPENRITTLAAMSWRAIRPEQIRENSDGIATLCVVKGKGGKVARH